MKRRAHASALTAVLVATMILSACSLFNDPARSRAQDGLPGYLPIEAAGTYREVSCAGYRDATGEVHYFEYQYSSSLAARSRLCPLSSSPGGGWRTSEDISIDENTDTVRLTADLDAGSYETPRTWPVPPSLVVYCWDLTETDPGELGVGLYHYGLPHDFTGSFRVRLNFNDTPPLSTMWWASNLEAEAIFLPMSELSSFVTALEDTNEDSGYSLEVEVAPRTPEASRISFNVSGWEKAVKPLLEECGAAL